MQGKRSTLPPIEELILLNEQFSNREIARRVSADPRYEKVSEGTIRNVLIAAGCKMRPRGGAGKGKPSPRKITDLPWEEIIHKYEPPLKVSGETLAEEHKVSPGVIYRGLVERGVELRESTAHVKDIWAERNEQLEFARQYPPDWFEKPLDWRIISDPLLQGPMSNLELAEQLLRGKLVKLAGYGQTAREISRHRAFVKRVNEIRNWLGRPGEVRGEVTK
jgi:hypothetical protein